MKTPNPARPNLASLYLASPHQVSVATKATKTAKVTLPHLPLLPLLFLALTACGGGGSTCVSGCDTNGGGGGLPTVAAYVGDTVGDYVYKYTNTRSVPVSSTAPFAPLEGTHYGYREPTCKYLPADYENYLNGDSKSVTLGNYLGTSQSPAKKGDAALDIYAYRETYDFSAIDATHMTFTHKISIYDGVSPIYYCTDVITGKRGEITRTGENTTKASPTNPNIFRNDGTGFWWNYFLVQRTGTSLFTWTGKTTLSTGETVDMFEVDLPELTNRSWSFQAWSTDSNKGGGVDLSHPLFNGKSKFKALVYMKRNTNATSPWVNTNVKIIMDPTNFMTSTPLDQWQSFDYFNPKYEPYNMYDLPTQ